MTAQHPVPAPVLNPWPTPSGISTAGSLYAVAPALQLAAARLLHEQARWVHVDVIVEGGRPVGGVALDLLAGVRTALPGARLEVHVIRRDAAPFSVDRVLDRVLATGPQRVILPLDLCGTTAALPRRVRYEGAQAWAEIAPGARIGQPRTLVDGTDGALVMLIPPGTRQDADPARLAAVRALTSYLPVGVDGGVGPQNTPDCLAAGAVHLVSGRALLGATDLTNTTREGAR